MLKPVLMNWFNETKIYQYALSFLDTEIAQVVAIADTRQKLRLLMTRSHYFALNIPVSAKKGHQIPSERIQRISYCTDSHSAFNFKTIHRCKEMQSLHRNIDIYSSISMHFLIRLPQMLHNKPQTIIWKSFQYQDMKSYVCHKSYFSCWSLVWFGLLSLKIQLHLLPVCQISSVKIVHFNGAGILLSTIKYIYLIRAL